MADLKRTGVPGRKSRLSEPEQAQLALEYFGGTASVAELAARYGLSETGIRHHLRKPRWQLDWTGRLRRATVVERWLEQQPSTSSLPETQRPSCLANGSGR